MNLLAFDEELAVNIKQLPSFGGHASRGCVSGLGKGKVMWG